MMTGRPEEAIYRFLDTNGDGTGTKNANGDYSVTAEEFYLQAERDCHIHRLIINISDAAGFQAQEYGNLGAALTNGYCVKVQDEAQNDIRDLCDGINIKTNGGIGRVCYDVEVKTWGAGAEFLQARWTFTKGGYPLYLPIDYRISITFNDDLSGLTEHYFMVQGYER